MENERIMIPFFINKNEYEKLGDLYDFAYFIISNIKNEGMPKDIKHTALVLTLDYTDCEASLDS